MADDNSNKSDNTAESEDGLWEKTNSSGEDNPDTNTSDSRSQHTGSDSKVEEDDPLKELADLDEVATKEEEKQTSGDTEEEPITKEDIIADNTHNETKTDSETVQDDSTNPEEDEFENDVANHIKYDSPPENEDSFIARWSWPGGERFDSDEELIIGTNPTAFFKLKEYLIGGFLFIGSLIALLHYAITTRPSLYQTYGIFGIEYEMPDLYMLNLILFGLFGLGFMIYHHISRKCTWYIITDQRTWVRSGILSKQDQGNLEHSNITNVTQKEPYPERLFGVGHIFLYTASTDGAEISLLDLKNTTTWKSEIRQKHKESKNSNGNSNSGV